MCVFSGQPYSDLQPEGVELRSKAMRDEQVAVDRLDRNYQSPRAVARRLPIARSKCVCVCVCVCDISLSLKECAAEGD